MSGDKVAQPESFQRYFPNPKDPLPPNQVGTVRPETIDVGARIQGRLLRRWQWIHRAIYCFDSPHMEVENPPLDQ